MYAGGYCLLGGQENMSSEPENEGCTEEKQGFCHVQFDLYGFGVRTQTGMMRRNKKSRAGIQYTRSCGSSSHPPANYKSVKYKHTQIVCIPLAKYLNSSSLCSTVAWVNRPLLWARPWCCCSVCERGKVEKRRGSRVERRERNLEMRWEAQTRRGQKVFVPEDDAGGELRCIGLEHW